MLANFDLNEAKSMDTAQVVELTFMEWQHKAMHTARIGGDCPGVPDCIDAAIAQLIDKLPTRLKNDDGSEYDCSPTLVLTDESGENTLLVDGNSDPEKWLEELMKELLVGVRIVAIEPAEG